jgi:uncharacterized Zn finger protein (UPF0148 family)
MATTHYFSVALADRYGPIESIILSNICWWLEYNKKNEKNYVNGRYWTYMSTSAFERMFTYLSKEQIKHTITKLRGKGVLITENFNRNAYDRTLWYTVPEEVMCVFENGRSEKDALRGFEGVAAEGEGADGVSLGQDAPGTAQEGEGEPQEGGETGQDGPGARGGTTGKETGPEWEKPHSHSGNFNNANGKNPIPIVEISTMDSGNLNNGLLKFPPPIPILKSYKKAVAVNPENDKKPPGVTLEATAAFSKNEVEESRIRERLTSISPDLVFGKGFYPRAVRLFGENGLDAGYCDWVYRKCVAKKPENARGLFFKLFFEDDIVLTYKTNIEKQAMERERVLSEKTCPACGSVHEEGLSSCPSCGMIVSRYGDVPEVEKQKRINALDAERREAYEKECRNLLFTLGNTKGVKIKDQRTAIEKKYHLIE